MTELEQKEEMNTLKPCPFCGEPGRVIETHKGHYQSLCTNEWCGCEIRVPAVGGDAAERAAKAWNKRANFISREQVKPLAEALRQILELNDAAEVLNPSTTMLATFDVSRLALEHARKLGL